MLGVSLQQPHIGDMSGVRARIQLREHGRRDVEPDHPSCITHDLRCEKHVGTRSGADVEYGVTCANDIRGEGISDARK